MEQNFKNHIRFNPIFHFFAVPATLLAIGTSIYAFTKMQDLTHGLIMVAFVLILFALLTGRLAALSVQNRAIITAETLRYYLLTNKQMPVGLKTSQIIALRFASNDELLALSDRAVSENLNSKEIKMAIKNWRADEDRV